MNKKTVSLSILAAVALIAAIFVYLSLNIVNEGERGYYTDQNQVEVLNPGVHFAWPWNQPQLVTVNNQVSSFAFSLPQNLQNLQLTILWNVGNVNSYVQNQENSNLVLNLLKTEANALVTPSFLANTSSPSDLANAILQGLNADPAIQNIGVNVAAVWVKGITPTDANQAKIYDSMKGLAATIGAQIIQSGEVQAEQIRDAAEQSFLQAQSAALTEAAKILGEGNSAAVKTIAPLYRQNPALFKAYVAAKAKLLTSQSGS